MELLPGIKPVRDKTSLNISSLKDKSLPVLDILQHPDESALDIEENLKPDLESFQCYCNIAK